MLAISLLALDLEDEISWTLWAEQNLQAVSSSIALFFLFPQPAYITIRVIANRRRLQRGVPRSRHLVVPQLVHKTCTTVCLVYCHLSSLTKKAIGLSCGSKESSRLLMTMAYSRRPLANPSSPKTSLHDLPNTSHRLWLLHPYPTTQDRARQSSHEQGILSHRSPSEFRASYPQ